MFIAYFIVLVVVAGVILILMNIRLLAAQQQRNTRQQEEAKEPTTGEAGSAPEVSYEGPNAEAETAATAARGVTGDNWRDEAKETPEEGDRAYREAIRQEAKAILDAQQSNVRPSAPAKPKERVYSDNDYRSALRGMTDGQQDVVVIWGQEQE